MINRHLMHYAMAKTAAKSDSPKRKEDSGGNGAYGSHMLSHFDTAPVSSRRELDPDEQAEMDEGRSRWLPQIFQSYATKPKDMMASPLKIGLLSSIPGAAVGGGIGASFGSKFDDMLGGSGMGTALGGGAGALLGGGLAGLVGGLSRNAENDTIEDLVRRLPKGSRKRDLYSDPLYNQDMMMAQMLANNRHASFGHGTATGASNALVRALMS